MNIDIYPLKVRNIETADFCFFNPFVPGRRGNMLSHFRAIQSNAGVNAGERRVHTRSGVHALA